MSKAPVQRDTVDDCRGRRRWEWRHEAADGMFTVHAAGIVVPLVVLAITVGALIAALDTTGAVRYGFVALLAIAGVWWAAALGSLFVYVVLVKRLRREVRAARKSA